MINDYATITLVDARGRTVCRFIKEKPDTGWCVEDFEPSRKARRHKTHPRDLKPHMLKRLPDGRQRLDLPGPPLFWEKLPPALDWLAARGATPITVDLLRAAAAYIK